MSFGTTELILILVIVALLFGTKKLRNIGSDVGGAIKGFKDSMATDDDPEKTAPQHESGEKTSPNISGE